MGRGSRVKGIVIELGGDIGPLDKAMGKVNATIGRTQNQLKDVERLLKLDPQNTELLRQKQELLAEAVEQTEDKLRQLNKANGILADGLDDITDEQYRALQREIADTEIKLRGLRKEADKAGEGFDALERDTKQLQRTMEDAGEEASTFADTLGAELVGEGLEWAMDTVVDMTQETAELREELSRLDQNAREAAVGIGQAREAWRLFTVQTGQSDSAVEAVSNLLQAGYTEGNLQDIVENLAGAVQRFPDTLTIESLADGLQETLATKSATGQYAELLERMGIDLEAFNAELALCADGAARQDLALRTLAEAGLAESYRAWRDSNAEMVRGKEASLDLQLQMAEMGKAVEPALTTGTELLGKFLGHFNALPDTSQSAVLTLVLLGGALMGLMPVFTALASGPGLLIAAIVALVSAVVIYGDQIQEKLTQLGDSMHKIFSADYSEAFGPVLGGLLESVLGFFGGILDGAMSALNGVIDFIQSVFALDLEGACHAVVDTVAGIFGGIGEAFMEAFSGIGEVLSGIADGWSKLTGGQPWVPGTDFNSMWNPPGAARGGVLLRGTAMVGENGPEILTVDNGKASVRPLSGNTYNRTTSLGGVTVNVFAAPGQSEEGVADAVARRLQEKYESEENGL